MRELLIPGAAVVGGATATAAVAAPVAVSTGVGLLGFGTGGITAGSWAAGFMASYGSPDLLFPNSPATYTCGL